MPAYINGVGMYAPERIVSNNEIAEHLGLTPEQIYRSSGIHRRRWAAPGTRTSDLAVEALSLAVNDAGIPLDEIDFLLFGTMTPDRFIPGSAPIMQSALKLGEIPCLDIRASCCGMIYGLQLAKALILSGQAGTVSLCLAEIQSTMLDISEASGNISMLFGDGASAMIISPHKRANSLEIVDVLLATDGTHAEDLGIRSPGTEFGSAFTNELREDFFPRMMGQTVIINALRKMVASCKKVLERNNLTADDIDWVIPHQANQNLLMQVGRALQIPEAKIVSVLENYGNTSTASMGIALAEFLSSGKLKTGDRLLLPAFGAGFTWGAALCMT